MTTTTCSPTACGRPHHEGSRETGRRILAVDPGLGYHEDRTPTHGYEPTREAAMAAFEKS